MEDEGKRVASEAKMNTEGGNASEVIFFLLFMALKIIDLHGFLSFRVLSFRVFYS